MDYHGTRVYAYEKHTVWGPVHTTSLLDGAGEHACWGTPWSPNEGVLDIPLSAASGSKIGIKVPSIHSAFHSLALSPSSLSTGPAKAHGDHISPFR